MNKSPHEILSDEFHKYLELNILSKIELTLPEDAIFYIISGSSIANAIFSFLNDKPLIYNDIDIFVFLRYNKNLRQVNRQFDCYSFFDYKIISQYNDKNLNYVLIATDMSTDIKQTLNNNQIFNNLGNTLSHQLKLDDFGSFHQNEFELNKQLLNPGFIDSQINQDVKDFIEEFDLNCCQAGYNPLTKKVFISEKFKKFLDDPTHSIKIEPNIESYLRTIARGFYKKKQYKDWSFNEKLAIEALNYLPEEIKNKPIDFKFYQILSSIPRISEYISFTKVSKNQYRPNFINNNDTKEIRVFQNIKQSTRSVQNHVLFDFLMNILKYKKYQQKIIISLIQNCIYDFKLFMNQSNDGIILSFKKFNYDKFIKLKKFFQAHSFFSSQLDFNRIEDCYIFFNKLSKKDNVFIGFVETLFSKKDGYMNPNDEFSFFADNNYFSKLDKYNFNEITKIFQDYEKINDKVLNDSIIIPELYSSNIQELNTISKLKNEGSSLNHCVGGYGAKVATKKCRIFSINYNGEKATLETSFTVDTLLQLKGVRNNTPSNELSSFVYDFLIAVKQPCK